jgi:hypothetical protein
MILQNQQQSQFSFLVKRVGWKSVSKFSAVCVLAASLVMSNVGVASASPRAAAVDKFTDWLFYRANPELNGRKLQSGDSYHIDEWQAIYNVINQHADYKKSCGGEMILTVYDHMTRTASSDYADPVLHRVADVISQHRNGTSGKITDPNGAAARQWWAIRRAISIDDPCD